MNIKKKKSEVENGEHFAAAGAVAAKKEILDDSSTRFLEGFVGFYRDMTKGWPNANFNIKSPKFEFSDK